MSVPHQNATVSPVLPELPTPLVEVLLADGAPSVAESPGKRAEVPVVPVPRVADRDAPSGEDSADLDSAARILGIDAGTLAAAGATHSPGDARRVPLTDGVGWLIGVGEAGPAEWREAGAALVRAARPGGEEHESGSGAAAPTELAVALPPGFDTASARELTFGLALGGYRFRVTERDEPATVQRVRLVASDDAAIANLRSAVEHARELAAATALARDLANSPSNVKDPAWLAETAARMAGDVPGLDAVVRDEAWLAEQGFGGVLAVGGGSASPPRLLELHWAPDHRAPAVGDSASDRAGLAGDETPPHLALVGKGITFDTGGLSLKPADGMHLMRTDMAGGAAVIGAVLAIARLELPVRVTALVPCAENHVSGSSYRPGDVVRHRGGRTTEVVNTDAEGRMVLADAIAYAVGGDPAESRPDAVVDVATLTGAMKVALGLRTGGAFASHDWLADRLLEAGAAVGESWWRMPLLQDHAEDVRSELADLRQAPPGPGGVTAGLFLREFTTAQDGTTFPWTHLDIAGPARAEQPYAEVTPGATGFAARTLVELVSRWS